MTRWWYVCTCSKGTLKGWAIKYYKGLGTSTAQEAKDYFSAIARHQIDFAMDDPTATGYNARTFMHLNTCALTNAYMLWARVTGAWMCRASHMHVDCVLQTT